jgi:DNA-binding transcriptional regulator of glucitol operon
MVFCTITKLTETNQNITIGSKKVFWVRSFHFWAETVHRFVDGPNQCIKCNHSMIFCTITKLSETNQKITVGSKKVDLVRSFRFRAETVHRFVNSPNRCIKCNPGMVFCTVTKLTETDQNITVGSKKLDWVRSFRFWAKTVHRFVNTPNRCIKCNPGMVFCTITKLTETNQNISIGSKKLDWVHSFRFWAETVHRFINTPNRCIKCHLGMVFCTVTKLTETDKNITIGSKKLD